MPKLYTIEAQVHQNTSLKKGYRVKVSLPELGMYINGMMVFPPHDQFTEWSIVAPSQRGGRGIWIQQIEFNKKLPLYQEIYDACVDAAKMETQFAEDVVLEDISDEPIDLTDIPF